MRRFRIIRYYVDTPTGFLVGPYFRRKSAERAAARQGVLAGIDPALTQGGRVVRARRRSKEHAHD